MHVILNRFQESYIVFQIENRELTSKKTEYGKDWELE